jgi:hypothetical protein
LHPAKTHRAPFPPFRLQRQKGLEKTLLAFPV